MAVEEPFPGRVDDFRGEGVEVVDHLHAFDPGDKSIDGSEIAVRDAEDCRECCCVRDAAVVCIAAGGEAIGQDCGELVG